MDLPKPTPTPEGIPAEHIDESDFHSLFEYETMEWIEQLRRLEGVQYVTEWPSSVDYIIALDYGATVDTILKIAEETPDHINLGEVGASQEHIVEIDVYTDG